MIWNLKERGTGNHHKPVILILAGGKGERFWPRSNEDTPKQLQKLYSHKTLLEETLSRARMLTDDDRIFIGCTLSMKKKIRNSCKGIRSNSFILEPEGKNTAPIIALACLLLEEKFPDAVQMIFPADHYIAPLPAFHQTMKKAIASARLGFLTTIGIPPTRPETDYGYIQLGKKITLSEKVRKRNRSKGVLKNKKSTKVKSHSLYQIASFREKPNRSTVSSYLKKGGFLWNSGIFVWLGKSFLLEMDRLSPKILQPIRSSYHDSHKLASAFSKLPSLPVDQAIMEKSKKGAVVTSSFQWDDTGSWDSLARLIPVDINGNYLVKRGDSVISAMKSKNNIIAVDEGLVALLGVENLTVVQEKGILFLADRACLSQMKEFLKGMRQNSSLQKYLASQE